MAGTISLSLSQQFNSLGEPLASGRLYFYQAGTSTPQDVFQDTDLSIEHPNPIILDAAGRVPQFFIADGQIKIRLTDENGVTQIAADNILVIGPSAGGGGGGSVDDTRLWQVGDLKARYGTGTHSGWVRANGRTIGSATSGATERANADCQELFEYLWQADANLTVSTGRGASAAADWSANKTIALPDWRGRGIVGDDEMGNSAASVLTATYYGTAANVLGAAGGSQSKVIDVPNLPSDPISKINDGAAFNVQVTLQGAQATVDNTSLISAASPGSSTAQGTVGSTQTPTIRFPADAFSVTSEGNDEAMSVVQPSRVATIYVKL